MTNHLFHGEILPDIQSKLFLTQLEVMSYLFLPIYLSYLPHLSDDLEVT